MFNLNNQLHPPLANNLRHFGQNQQENNNNVDIEVDSDEDFTQDTDLTDIDKILLKLYPKLESEDWNEIPENKNVNSNDNKFNSQAEILDINSNDFKSRNKLEILFNNKNKGNISNFESILGNLFEKFKITPELRNAFSNTQEKKNIKFQNIKEIIDMIKEKNNKTYNLYRLCKDHVYILHELKILIEFDYLEKEEKKKIVEMKKKGIKKSIYNEKSDPNIMRSTFLEPIGVSKYSQKEMQTRLDKLIYERKSFDHNLPVIQPYLKNNDNKSSTSISDLNIKKIPKFIENRMSKCPAKILESYLELLKKKYQKISQVDNIKKDIKTIKQETLLAANKMMLAMKKYKNIYCQKKRIKAWYEQTDKLKISLHNIIPANNNEHPIDKIKTTQEKYLLELLNTLNFDQIKKEAMDAISNYNYYREIAQEMASMSEPAVCKICLINSVNRVITPCGHTCCSECSDALLNQKQCFNCRGNVEKMCKLYI